MIGLDPARRSAKVNMRALVELGRRRALKR